MRPAPATFIFVAGQVARDENNEWVGIGDAGTQAAQVYRNIGRILAHIGATPDRRRQDQHHPGRPQRSRRGHRRAPEVLRRPPAAAYGHHRLRSRLAGGEGRGRGHRLCAREETTDGAFRSTITPSSIKRAQGRDRRCDPARPRQRPARLGRRGAGLRGGIRRLERRRATRSRSARARPRSRSRFSLSGSDQATRSITVPNTDIAVLLRHPLHRRVGRLGRRGSRQPHHGRRPPSRRPSRRAPAPSCRSISSATRPISSDHADRATARAGGGRGCLHRARRDDRRAKGRHLLRRHLLQLRADQASRRFWQRRRVPDRGRRSGRDACARSPATARRARATAPSTRGALPQGLHHETDGTNERLDEIQAAVLRVKLRDLDETLAARRAQAARYERGPGRQRRRRRRRWRQGSGMPGATT